MALTGCGVSRLLELPDAEASFSISSKTSLPLVGSTMVTACLLRLGCAGGTALPPGGAESERKFKHFDRRKKERGSIESRRTSWGSGSDNGHDSRDRYVRSLHRTVRSRSLKALLGLRRARDVDTSSSCP